MYFTRYVYMTVDLMEKISTAMKRQKFLVPVTKAAAGRGDKY